MLIDRAKVHLFYALNFPKVFVLLSLSSFDSTRLILFYVMRKMRGSVQSERYDKSHRGQPTIFETHLAAARLFRTSVRACIPRCRDRLVVARQGIRADRKMSSCRAT